MVLIAACAEQDDDLGTRDCYPSDGTGTKKDLLVLGVCKMGVLRYERLR
jgi:hypothetical protein